MDITANLKAMQEIADYRAARKTLRGDGIANIIFGLLAVGLGIGGLQDSYLNLILVVIGLFLLTSALIIFINPGPAALIFGGIGLLLVGIWNISITILEMIAGVRPSPAFAILGCYQIYWGIRMMGPKSRHAAIRLQAPPSEAVAELDKLAKEMKARREKDGEEFIEMTVSGQTPVYYRGKLAPDTLFMVDASGTHMHFLTRDEIDVTLKKDGPLKKKNKATVTMRSDTLVCTISSTSYTRFKEWKTCAPPA